MQVLSLGWKIPCRRERQPTLVFLPGEFHGQKSLVGCSPWGHKESDTAEQLTHTHTHTHTRITQSEWSEEGKRKGQDSWREWFSPAWERF